MRVLHHQAVQLTSRREAGAAEQVTFNAYGRRFDLALTPNERIRRAITSANSTTMPFEGTSKACRGRGCASRAAPAAGAACSIDGQELYAIEAAQDIAGSTDEPLNATGSASVIYRLADAVLPLDEMTCEIAVADPDEPPPTAAAAFKQLSLELHAIGRAARSHEAGANRRGRRLRVLHPSSLGASPEDAIVARMNIVDGIFSTQLGVKISLAPLRHFHDSERPLHEVEGVGPARGGAHFPPQLLVAARAGPHASHDGPRPRR